MTANDNKLIDAALAAIRLCDHNYIDSLIPCCDSPATAERLRQYSREAFQREKIAADFF